MKSYEIEELTKAKLLIPAGKCPVLLEDTTVEAVERWVKKIKQKIGNNFDCKPTVFRYWARIFYHNDLEKFEEVNKNISIVTNSSATLYDYMMGKEK